MRSASGRDIRAEIVRVAPGGEEPMVELLNTNLRFAC